MKKLISALSSLCIAVSSLLPAFPAFTASAAVQADGVQAEAGTVVYDLIAREGEKTVTDGVNVFQLESKDEARTVKVDWVVSSEGAEFAGVNYEFAFPKGIYKSVLNGNVYDGDPTFQLNADKTALDIAAVSPANLTPAAGSKIVTFNLTIPAGDGEYSVTLLSGGKASTVDYNGKDVSAKLNPITLKVGNSTTPATTSSAEGTTTAPTTTTSEKNVETDPIPSGTVAFDLLAREGEKSFNGTQNVFALESQDAARTVKVDWVVSSDGVAFAGVNYQFAFTKGIYKSVLNGNVYDGDPTFDLNADKTELDIAAVSPANLTPAAGDKIATFNLTIPAGEGVYTIGLVSGGKAATVDYNGKDVPAIMHTIKLVVGGATVQETTTAPTTTTSAPSTSDISVDTEPIPAGTVAFDLYAREGEKSFNGKQNVFTLESKDEARTVKVDWVVSSDGVAFAGVNYEFSFTKGLYKSALNGNIYEGDPTFNLNADKTALDFAAVSPANLTPAVGDKIATFNVTIPAGEGVYTIDLLSGGKAAVVDYNGKDVPSIMNTIKLVVGGATPQETTTTSSSVNPSLKAVTYDLLADGMTGTLADGYNTYEVTPGQDVTIKWVQSAASSQTAGIGYNFDFGDITLGKNVEGNAFDGNAPTINVKGSVLEFAYAQSEALEISAGAVIHKFKVTVPETKGTYKVTLDPKGTNVTVDRDTNEIPVTFNLISFVVKDAAETTTTAATTTKSEETTTTTSSSAPTPAGTVNWTIDTVTVTAGAEIELPVRVSADSGTAGIDIVLDPDSALQITGIEWGSAYSAGEQELNAKKAHIIWASKSSADENGDGIAFVLKITAPTEPGIYPVTFKSIEILNTDGQPLTVTTKNGAVIIEEPVIAAGEAEWEIDTKTVGPGETVEIPVYIRKDEGTAGFKAKFAFDTALELVSFKAGDAYTGEIVVNDGKFVEVWADDKGVDQKAAADAIVGVFTFVAPAAAGTYPVEFTTLEVINTDGQPLTVTKKNGAVIVDAPVIPAGEAEWEIDTQTVEAGADVVLPVYIRKDEGTAGFVAKFAYDPALTFKGIEAGNAYVGDITINGDKLTIVWADDKGEDQKAAADSVVINFLFTAPAAAGEYPVTFQKLEAVNTDGQPLEITKKDGAVIVLDYEPHTAEWEIDTQIVGAGADVVLPVYIRKDEGTAGYVAKFTYDPALTFKGIEAGNAYVGDITINDNKLTIVWADDNGEDQVAAADSVVINFLFTAPTAAGEYPVQFTSLEVVDANGKPVVVTKKDGAVIVEETTTTTTTTTTTESETTTTTTTTTDGTETTTTTTTTDGTETTTTTTTDGTENTTTTSTSGATETTTSTTSTSGASETTTSTTSTSGASETTTSTTSTSGASETTTSTTSTSGASETTTSTTSTSGASETTTSTTSTSGASETTTSTTSTSGASETTTSTTTSNGSDTTATTSTTSNGTETTTTSSSQSEPGEAEWQIDEVYTAGGVAVTVPVRIMKDAGTAAYIVKFAYDPALTFVGISGGDAYGNGEIILNNDKIIALWADDNGAEQQAAAEAIVLNLQFIAPTADGRYPVTFTKLEVVDTDGAPVSVTTVDGAVIVTSETTTTTTTTSISGETTTTTNTTGTETTASGETTATTSTTGTETMVSGETTTTTSTTATESNVSGETTTTTSTTATESNVSGETTTTTSTSATGTQTTTTATTTSATGTGTTTTETTTSATGTGTTATETTTSSTGTTATETTTSATGTQNTTTETTTSASGTGSTTESTTTVSTTVSSTSESSTTVSTTVSSTSETSTTVSTTDSTVTETSTTVSDTTESSTSVSSTTESSTTASTTETSTTASTTETTATTESGSTTSTTETTTGGSTEGTTSATTETTTGGSTEGTTSATTETTTGGSTEGTTSTTTTETTTSGSTETETSTTTTETTTSDTTETETSATTTETTASSTETTPSTTVSTSVVTEYSISFTEPTRRYYWSHDTRSFVENGGLGDMAAELTLNKYYVNENGEFVDENGNVIEKTPFETKKLDITKYVNTLAIEDTPAKVWENEGASHAHEYTLGLYFFSDGVDDPDFRLAEPLKLGEYTIFIGVKGDTNLDDTVDLYDVINLTEYYVLTYLLGMNDEAAMYPADEHFEDLTVFLANVCFRVGGAGESAANTDIEDPILIDLYDVLSETEYYNHNYLLGLDDTWTDIVGYDLLDRFYGGIFY